MLPLPFLHRLGALLGALVYRIPNESTHATRVNLSICFPELSPDEREALTKVSMKEMGKAVFEAGPLWLWSAEKANAYINNIQGEDIYDRAVEAKQGVIVLTPHLGNWEILNFYLSRASQQVTGLYSPHTMPAVDALVYKGRGRTGSILVPATPKGLIKVRKALSHCGITMILPDQQPHRDNGVYAPFFGQTALTMRLIYAMLQKTNSRIVCMYGKRLDHGEGFDIVCREPDALIYSEDAQESIAALNRSMEQCIRDIPEQYNWAYKRFSKQPEHQRLYKKN